MKQRNQYLMKNTIIFAIGNFGTKMISFFLVPLYTNLLSPGEYGIVDLILTIGTVIIPFLTFNIADGIMRFALDKDADYKQITGIGIIMMIFSTLAIFLLMPFFQMSESLKDYSALVCVFTVTLGYSQIALANLRGQEKLLQYSVGNIIQSFAIALLNIIFLSRFQEKVEGYLWAYIIANCLTTVYALLKGNMKAIFQGFHIQRSLVKEMFKYSLGLMPNALMWWIMNSSDRIMITAFLGASANGLFAVAYKIPTLLTTVANTFTQAWSYSAIREAESEDKDDYSNKVYDGLVAVVLLLSCGMILFIKPFFRFYVEKSYFIAWRYVPFLIISFVFITLSTFVGTTYIVYKDSKGFLKGAILGAVLNIVLNLILIPQIGINGAGVATAVGYFFVFIYRVKDTQKYLKLIVMNKRDVIGYVLLFLMSATVYWDTWKGYVMLFAEFLCIVVVFRKFIVEMFQRLLKRQEITK